MNTNTKFPPLPNPFLLQHNKHGSLPVPITIFNGNNKPPNNVVQEGDNNNTEANIYDYYKDTTSDEMIYEEKPTIKKYSIYHTTYRKCF